MTRSRSIARPSGPYAVGIDVGGTKIAAGLVSVVDGQVVSAREIPTPRQEGGATVLAAAHALAQDLHGEGRNRGTTPVAIGLSLCEIVDPQGRIRSSHAVPWEGLPVRERLGTVAPTFLEADVRAAALAESRFGAARGLKVALYVTIGTGISCCLLVDGRVHPGALGGAGTLATGPFPCLMPGADPGPALSLEDVASGPGLHARLLRAGGAAASGRETIEAAERGDPLAVEVVVRGGSALGAALGWLVDVLDPEAIILGGGVGLVEGRYRGALVESLRRHIWWPAHRGIPVLTARTGTQAAFIGAALGAYERSLTRD